MSRQASHHGPREYECCCPLVFPYSTGLEAFILTFEEACEPAMRKSERPFKMGPRLSERLLLSWLVFLLDESKVSLLLGMSGRDGVLSENNSGYGLLRCPASRPPF